MSAAKQQRLAYIRQRHGANDSQALPGPAVLDLGGAAPNSATQYYY